MKDTIAAIAGISYVEVVEARPSAWTLCVHLFVQPGVDLDGVLKPTNIRVRWVDLVPSALAVLSVEMDAAYADAVLVRVTSEIPTTQTSARMDVSLEGIHGLDAVRASVQINVRTNSDQQELTVDPDLAVPPLEIDYLSKDYNSFRQTFFDTLTQRIPNWTERHAADELVAVAEVLAYAADYLSAYQDAVATEAYLTTARLRTSVRRHARLLDYHLFEGCAARVLLAFEVNEDPVEVAPGLPVTGAAGHSHLRGPYIDARDVQPNAQVFETLEGATFFVAHNRIEIAVESDQSMQVFPAGSTRATLRGHLAHLAKGSLLVFEQAEGARRHGVRLSSDPVFVTGPNGEDATLVTWFEGDATPFDFVIAARDVDGVQRRDVTIVRGNVVSAQQGAVKFETLRYEPLRAARLMAAGMLFAVPFDAAAARECAVSRLLDVDPRKAVAEIRMFGTEPYSAREYRWSARRDLMRSGPFSRHFVAEIESDRTVTIRFGDGVHGRRPVSGTAFRVEYRVGSTESANVGCDVLGAIVLNGATPYDERITRVYNPIAALAGAEPESAESARRTAPEQFRTQQRCVTAADFLAAVRADDRVRNAVTVPWWSGTERVTLVYVQPTDLLQNMTVLVSELERRLAPLLIAGEFAAVRPPVDVPLFLRMLVTTDPSRPSGSIVKGVYDALEQAIADAHLTFAQSVYASPLIAAAMRVDGVLDAQVSALTRYALRDVLSTTTDVVEIGPTEIARLDNDRLRPENGVILIDVATAVVA